MTAQEVEVLLRQYFTVGEVQVSSPDEVHFEAYVASPLFAGKTRVQQQQMVYAVVKPHIESGEIHALGMKTSCA